MSKTCCGFLCKYCTRNLLGMKTKSCVTGIFVSLVFFCGSGLMFSRGRFQWTLLPFCFLSKIPLGFVRGAALWGVQDQIGWGFVQPALEEGVLACGRGLERDECKVPSKQNHSVMARGWWTIFMVILGTLVWKLIPNQKMVRPAGAANLWDKDRCWICRSATSEQSKQQLKQKKGSPVWF